MQSIDCIRHIESVFAVLVRKCGSFQERGQTDGTHFLYSYRAMPSLAYTILFKCGALYRLFSQGYFHNLLTNKRESSPHFLFIITNRIGDATVIISI